MGILSYFTSGRDRSSTSAGPDIALMVVDLGTFQIGTTALGAPPSSADSFASAFNKAGVFEPKGQGVEIGTKDGLLDYGFFTLSSFGGSFTRNGKALSIGAATTEQEIRDLFGEAYWVDRSDGEIICFYEYPSCGIELQFEFPEGTTLGHITLSRNGVLSNAEQRMRYGVSKPWPPQ